MLTLEQVQEGRSLEAAYDKYRGADESDALFGWFLEHSEALLDAAERVARDAALAADVEAIEAEPAKVIPELAEALRERAAKARREARDAAIEAFLVRHAEKARFEVRDELVEGPESEALWKATEARVVAIRQRDERFPDISIVTTETFPQPPPLIVECRVCQTRMYGEHGEPCPVCVERSRR